MASEDRVAAVLGGGGAPLAVLGGGGAPLAQGQGDQEEEQHP